MILFLLGHKWKFWRMDWSFFPCDCNEWEP